MTLVSIILPTFNVANYIEKSLKSILNQSYTNFEVIVVNDGSTDNVLEVLDNMELDSRFKVLSKKNEGSGIARNYGLKYSSGDYIYFMDPDDTIESNMLEETVEALNSSNSDFCIFGYREVYSNQKVANSYNINKGKIISNSKELHQELLTLSTETSIVAIWNKVFRKSFLTDNNLQFTNLPIGQDAEFCWNMFNYADTLVSIPKIYYNYLIERPGSARTKYNPKKYPSELAVLNQMIETTSNWENEYLVNQYIRNHKINIIISEMINIKKSDKLKLTSLKKFDLFNEVSSWKLSSVKGIKQKLKLFIIKSIKV